MKPANIIVDATGRPRVLDFGVARLTDSDVQVTTMQTDIGKLIGTIPYMSPEQAGGNPDDLDTRSDVYALGVILYRLLAGRLPYSLDNLPIPDAVRVVRESDPTPLSSVNRVFRGDVETIVAKALAKEKERRYQSVAALGSDIRRHLNSEPIEARQTSVVYQLRKFARRHRSATSAFCLIVASLLITILALATASTVASHSRDAAFAAATEQRRLNQELEQHVAEVEAATQRANESNDSFEATIQFLTQVLFSLTPEVAQGQQPLLIDALNNFAEAELREPIANQRAQASIDAIVAETYRRLGDFKKAEFFFDRSLATELSNDDADQLARSKVLNNLATLYVETNRREKAIEIERQVLQDRTDRLGPDHEDTFTAMANLAAMMIASDLLPEAEALYRRALAAREQKFGPLDFGTLRTKLNLAHNLRRQTKYMEFEELALEVSRDATKAFGDCHPMTNDARIAYGLTLKDQRRWWEAAEVFEKAVECAVSVHGMSSREAATARFQLAWAYGETDRLDQTLDIQDRILAESENIDDTFRTQILGTSAVHLMRQNRLGEAERRLCEAMNIELRRDLRQSTGPVSTMNTMSLLYKRTGRTQEAINLAGDAARIVDSKWPNNHRLVAQVHANLGKFLMEENQLALAQIHLKHAAERFAQLKDSRSTHEAILKDLASIHEQLAAPNATAPE